LRVVDGDRKRATGTVAREELVGDGGNGWGGVGAGNIGKNGADLEVADVVGATATCLAEGVGGDRRLVAGIIEVGGGDAVVGFRVGIDPDGALLVVAEIAASDNGVNDVGDQDIS